MTPRRRVLILCTGNSARSQMAEGWVRHELGEQWEPYSAGTAPAGYVHPLAVRVMAEVGVDISAQRSKSVDAFRDQDFDVVITVCDGARERCPVWLGRGRRVHIGFPDPAAVDGPEEARLAAFRAVRDAIRARVLGYLKGGEHAPDDL